MSDTFIEKRFKMEDAYRVFTEEMLIEDDIAECLIHRDLWELVIRMREVGAGTRKPPEFKCPEHLRDFDGRCRDVYFGYVYHFDAYTGEVCIDLDDGGNVQALLCDVIRPDLLKRPEDMDEWAPWIRPDIDTIENSIEEYSGLGVDNVSIDIWEDSSSSTVTLRYTLKN